MFAFVLFWMCFVVGWNVWDSGWNGKVGHQSLLFGLAFLLFSGLIFLTSRWIYRFIRSMAAGDAA